MRFNSLGTGIKTTLTQFYQIAICEKSELDELRMKLDEANRLINSLKEADQVESNDRFQRLSNSNSNSNNSLMNMDRDENVKDKDREIVDLKQTIEDQQYQLQQAKENEQTLLSEKDQLIRKLNNKIKILDDKRADLYSSLNDFETEKN